MSHEPGNEQPLGPNNQPIPGSERSPGRAADPLDELMRWRRRQRNRQKMIEQGARIVSETEGQGSFLEDE